MSNDARAFQHYEKSANREPAPGPARKLKRPPRPALTEYVPIRLSTEAMDAIREQARSEGISVSAWIRRLIDRELSKVGPDDPAAQVGALAAAVERVVERSLKQLEARLQQAERTPAA